MKRVTGTAVNASLLGLAVALAPGAPAAADEIRADQWHPRYLSVAEAHERT